MHSFGGALVGLLAAAAVLAGCNTTSAVVVPKAKPAAVRGEAAGPKAQGAVIALDSISTTIGRRETVFTFPQQFEAPALLCNYPLSGDQNISLLESGEYLGNWPQPMAELFYEQMRASGYKMIGDRTEAFAQARQSGAAEYLVAGRLTRMTGNMCHAYSWFSGRLLYEFGGELYVNVEWSVLNTLTNEVVLTESHDGYYNLMPPIDEGVFFTFEGAFEDSIRKFAASPKMIALAEGGAVASLPEARRGASIAIASGAAAGRFDIDRTAPAVVTVKVGSGHGSGFFNGDGGHVMTNAHVVGEARRALVRTASGAETTATVIRTDPARDVALLIVDLPSPPALAIQTSAPRPTDMVYAIGSPIDEALSNTVTRGIVSANRVDKTTGQSFIQADVAISPGNSGGPLFDDRGAVVGVTVSKVISSGAEGLNLFIPIASALASVGVVM